MVHRPAVIANQIDFRPVAAAFDASRIFTCRQGDAFGIVTQRSGQIERRRIARHELTAVQIQQARFDALGEQRLDLLTFHLRLQQAGYVEDIALLVEQLLLLLFGLQADGGTRHHHRTHQAQQQYHQQRFTDAVVFRFIRHGLFSA
ncbi:hypothetical protein D3C79_845930 [compost metagenome]